MLARKYDEYAWELEEQQENTVRQTAYVKRPKQRNLKLMRRRIAVVAGILLATYFACVVRSECLISKSNDSLKTAGSGFDAGKQRGTHCC